MDKPFIEFLTEIEGGDVLQELAAELQKVTEAVSLTRKPGSLKLNIKIEPTGKGTISVIAAVDSKIPEDPPAPTTFFLGPDYQLQRRDPNQPSLPLREVEGMDRKTGEIRDIPSNRPPLRSVHAAE